MCVVALVVLAGCSGFPGGSGEDGPTATPAPVPGTEVGVLLGQSEATLPPGLESDGTVDRARLAAAHRSALENTSYTLYRRAWTLNRSDLHWARYTRLQAVSPSRYRYVYWTAGDTDHYVEDAVFYEHHQVYVDSSGAYDRERNQVTGVWNSSTLNRSEVRSPSQFSTETVIGYLPERIDSVDTVDIDGEPYYRLQANVTAAELPSGRLTEGERYNLTAYVSLDGFVRTVVLHYGDDYEGPEGSLREGWSHSVRITHQAIDETTMVEPAWVDRIRDRATSAG